MRILKQCQFLLIAFGVLFFLSACNAGGEQNSTSSNDGTISVGQVATLLIDSTESEQIFYLPVNNNSSTSLGLHSYSLNINGVQITRTIGTTSVVNEVNIQPLGQAILIVKVPLSSDIRLQGSFMLQVEALDASGKSYIAQTLVNYSRLTSIKPINIPEPINYNLNSSAGNWLAIPVLMDKSITNPQILLDNSNENAALFCSPESALNHCTVLLNMRNFNSQTGNSAELKIIDILNTNLSESAIIALSVSNAGNIAIGGLPAIISPSNGATKILITLFNNGNQTVSSLSESVITPISLESNNCTSSLAVGSSCTFKLSANSTINGTSTLTVAYDNGNGPVNVSIPISYFYTIQPSLAASVSSSSGSFLGILKNSSTSKVFRFTNLSTVNLIYKGEVNPSKQNVAFSESSGFSASDKCTVNATLVPGGSCVVSIIYAPTVGNESGVLQVIPIFNYYIQDQSYSYSAASLTVSYSSSNSYYMYFGNIDTAGTAGNRNVARCNLLTSGNFSGCAVTQVPAISGKSFYASQLVQYSTNPVRVFIPGKIDGLNSDPVWNCTIESTTGNLINCTRPSIVAPESFSWAPGMAVNNGYSYLINYVKNTPESNFITKCRYSESGIFTNCSSYRPSDLGLSSGTARFWNIAIAQNIAYITSPYNSWFYKCAISESSGALQSCTSITPTATTGDLGAMTDTEGIAVNGSTMYLTDWQAGAIWTCQINDWSNCNRYFASNVTKALGLTFYGTSVYVSREESINNVVRFSTNSSTGNLESATASIQSFSGLAKSTLGLGISF